MVRAVDFRFWPLSTFAATQRYVCDSVLQAKGEPTREAEGLLEVYLSSLKLLEDHEWKMRQERKAKKGETKKIK